MLHRLLLKAGVGFQPIFLSDHQNILSLYHLPVKAPDLVFAFHCLLEKGQLSTKETHRVYPKTSNHFSFYNIRNERSNYMFTPTKTNPSYTLLQSTCTARGEKSLGDSGGLQKYHLPLSTPGAQHVT